MGRFGLVAGLVAALVYGLWSGLGIGLGWGLVYGLGWGLVYGLGWGLVYGLVAGFVGGLASVWNVPATTASDATPSSTYRKDAHARLGAGLVFGIAVGVVDGILFGLDLGIAVGLTDGIVFGIVVGLVFGLVVGTSGEASPHLLFAEMVLRVRFMLLLETALKRQVLRQAGAVYQFRHAHLQDHLATRYRPRTPD